MKKLFILGATLVAANAALLAQTFTVTAPGYTARPLVTSTPGYSISAVATDGAGRLFYFENDSNFLGSLPSKLWQLTFDQFTVGTPSLIHNFGANLAGSFLKYSAGQLYLGENTSFGLYAIDPLTSAVNALGTIPGAYDADFSGVGLYVSNASGGSQKISRFTIVSIGGGAPTLSLGTVVLNAGAQSSGPLQFTSAGDLIYGSSAGGIYRYTAAELAGGGLTLDAGHLVVPSDANSYLADAGGTSVWRDSYLTNELRLIDTATANSTVIGTAGGIFPGLGDLDSEGDTLVFAVTDYGSFPSVPTTVYAVTPEPSTALLLTLGLASFAARRQRRTQT